MIGQSSVFKQPSLPVSIGAWVLLSACATLLGFSTPPAPAAIQAPDANEFRASDHPSDDGSVIVVEWAQPEEKLPQGAYYVVEIALSKDDFGTDKARSIPVTNLATKAMDPQYFGFIAKELQEGEKDKDGNPRKVDKSPYFIKVTPSSKRPNLLFPPDLPPKLAGDGGPTRIALLLKEGRLTPAAAQRANRALHVEELGAGRVQPGAIDELLKDGAITDVQARWAHAAFLKSQLAAGKITVKQLDKLFKDRGFTPETGKVDPTTVTDKIPDELLSAQELADRAWLGRFRTFLGAADAKHEKKLSQAINGKTYYFRLAVKNGEQMIYASRGGEPTVVSAAAESNLFKGYKLNNLLFALIFCGTIAAFIQVARRNPNLFIRKMPGLDAIEEAIGRATEMGRSAFFVHGLATMAAPGTIAAVSVLSRVAQRAAEYDTRVKVMNYDPIVTAVCQEVVQQAYTEGGRPDAYNADDVAMIASQQFAYVAAIAGRMVRERPAAIFLMGYFYAESLLLAETGASTGAIQVAGTDAFTQLPFFITTCDYTLIGEELYAASAYLSREPKMLGSLRGQDVGKAFLMAVIVISAIILLIWPELGVLFKNLLKPF